MQRNLQDSEGIQIVRAIFPETSKTYCWWGNPKNHLRWPQMLFFHGFPSFPPLSKSFGASQVVQDLFHQPYHSAHLDFLQVFSVDDPMECTEWTRKRPFATEAPHDLRGSGTWMLLETRLRSDDRKKGSPFQRFVVWNL